MNLYIYQKHHSIKLLLSKHLSQSIPSKNHLELLQINALNDYSKNALTYDTVLRTMSKCDF